MFWKVTCITNFQALVWLLSSTTCVCDIQHGQHEFCFKIELRFTAVTSLACSFSSSFTTDPEILLRRPIQRSRSGVTPMKPQGKWDSFAAPCKQVMRTVEFALLKTIAAQAHWHWVFIFSCKEQRFISTIQCSPFYLLLRRYINNSCLVFHQRFQTPRNNESTPPTASCFHQFLGVWNLW